MCLSGEVGTDLPKERGVFEVSFVSVTVRYDRNGSVVGCGANERHHRHRGGIEPLRVPTPLELKSSPSASPTHHGIRHFGKKLVRIMTFFLPLG